MAEQRVLVTCDLGPEALGQFSREPGLAVELRDIRDEETLASAVAGFHALVVRSNVKVTERVLRAGTDLVVVGRAGIGVDNIDLEAATRLGIAVVNAPGGNVVTTAEHALALLLSLARRIPQATASMKAGRWEKKRFMGRELRGKTLGIVGLGRVGSALAEVALGVRLRVLAADPYLSDERASRVGVEKVSLERLASESDFVSVHTPLTPETRGLLGEAFFERVRPGLLLVNCARGGIVDEQALLRAIEAGKVAGAALDVFEVEPPPPSPLYGRDEVILTPHLGASTVEAQANVAVEVAENVAAYLSTGSCGNALNAPGLPSEILRRLGPHLELAERLGSFLAQVAPGAAEAVSVSSWGEALEEGADLIASAFLKGLLAPALSVRVTTINAPVIARERGIRVAVTRTRAALDFSELISVTVSGAWGEHRLAGTLFGRSEPRLVQFDGYRLDALPKGTLLLIYNDDVPGVIGGVGNCLGRHGVNIAGMYNGRAQPGGRAITLVNIDGSASPEVLQALTEVPHVQSARQVFL